MNESYVKPNFLICGAAKSGTTSLYEILKGHDDVCMSVPKEPNYFRNNYSRGIEWYSNCFDCDGERCIGEASVSNMVDPDITVERIKETLGKNVKLLFLLRDPSERAYSDYFDSVRGGRIDHEEGKFGRLIRGQVDLQDPHVSNKSHGNRILERGMYYDQIKQFIESFSRKNIKIMIAEKFYVHTKKEVNSVLRFLGVDVFESIEEDQYNEGDFPGLAYKMVLPLRSLFNKYANSWMKRKTKQVRRYLQTSVLTKNKPKMKKEDRKYLIELYMDQIIGIEDIIGEELSGWKKIPG